MGSYVLKQMFRNSDCNYFEIKKKIENGIVEIRVLLGILEIRVK